MEYPAMLFCFLCVFPFFIEKQKTKLIVQGGGGREKIIVKKERKNLLSSLEIGYFN